MTYGTLARDELHLVRRLDAFGLGGSKMSDLVFIAFDNEKQAEEVREKVLEYQRRISDRGRRRCGRGARWNMSGSNLTSFAFGGGHALAQHSGAC